ncbi:unnamed protein product [Boreogadus saida]
MTRLMGMRSPVDPRVEIAILEERTIDSTSKTSDRREMPERVADAGDAKRKRIRGPARRRASRGDELEDEARCSFPLPRGSPVLMENRSIWVSVPPSNLHPVGITHRTELNDVLARDAGECVICLEELQQGDTIARLPCLCIYHKSCIDSWFEINRSCPEHPSD